MKKVVIFQYRLLHYRVKLFDELKKLLQQKGVDLYLVYGQPSRRESSKRDTGRLDWAQPVRNTFFETGSRDIVWQPFPTDLRDADLVIVMQENRILSNYPLLLGRLWSDRKIAYWGHGVNFQSDAPTGFREKWKRLMLNRVDWWFAYTQMTVDILMSAGYPPERTTCLNNAIDNESFQRDLSDISESTLAALREELQAPHGSKIGIFCGSLYPDKRLDYMIEAADIIHSEIHEFKLVIIGDGPSADFIRSSSLSRPWIKWAGVCKGVEKAAWFKLADVVINPGLVGLHVLDSFCSGTPMITTAASRHSPEISYLKNGINGLIVDGNPSQYADSVIELFRSPSKLEALKAAALQDANHYTLDNMVKNFADGIEQCLAVPSK